MKDEAFKQLEPAAWSIRLPRLSDRGTAPGPTARRRPICGSLAASPSDVPRRWPCVHIRVLTWISRRRSAGGASWAVARRGHSVSLDARACRRRRGGVRAGVRPRLLATRRSLPGSFAPSCRSSAGLPGDAGAGGSGASPPVRARARRAVSRAAEDAGLLRTTDLFADLRRSMPSDARDARERGLTSPVSSPPAPAGSSAGRRLRALHAAMAHRRSPRFACSPACISISGDAVVSHQTAVLRIGSIARHDFRVLDGGGVDRHRVDGPLLRRTRT